MSGYVLEILVILGLILLNGYFASAEIALISVRRASLTAAAERGSRGAKAALMLTEDPSRLLATVQFGVTTLSLGASAIAATSIGLVVEAWAKGLPVPGAARIAPGVSVLIVTLVVSYLTLVLGELTPKRIGLRYADTVAVRVSRPLAFIARATAPAVWILARSSDAVSRLLRVEPGAAPGVTEEEIKLLVTEQGTLLDEEKRMIHEIFELGDTVAREIMVPRVDAEMLQDTASIEEAVQAFRRTGFSRIPIYREDPDRIVGVLLLKDIFTGTDPETGECRPVVDLMRRPYFVPETKQILGLLAEMRATRSHMAVVVDEYGGTAGLVTIEDIVEEIVGEIADEFDPDRALVRQVGEREWAVEGRLPVEDAREMVGLAIPEAEEYDTLAGWVLVELGHIPAPGESVSVGGATVRVQTMRRRRIARLVVTIAPPAVRPG
jgi:putative hemolysin